MFTQDGDDRTLAVKPMNRPGHIQVFKQGLKSYRDLRAALRRVRLPPSQNEPSGLCMASCGSAFTQDDAHIFCTDDQIGSECKAFCDLLLGLSRLGFTDVGSFPTARRSGPAATRSGTAPKRR